LRAGPAGVAAACRRPARARARAASSTAMDHSRSSSSCPRATTASSAACHRPALVHSVNRRCAVGTATPKDGGSRCHGQPLITTKTIAVHTARSSARARPPPCGRDRATGSSGRTSAHNESGRRRRDNASSTAADGPSGPAPHQMRRQPSPADLFGTPARFGIEGNAHPGDRDVSVGCVLTWPDTLRNRGSGTKQRGRRH
jgi:hypothetical protein